ncbi:MAG: hypothetical protein ABSF76_04390 [Opitutaceae bacterium]
MPSFKAIRTLATGVALFGGCAAIVWTALGRWHMPEIGARQPDYYNLLVSGFRKGSLALDIEVPRGLREAKDPLEYFNRATVAMPHDLSYYHGHFYAYHGAVPAVVLFWPFRAATGHDLPLVLGSLAFAVGAFLAVAWLWLRIVHDHFGRAGWATRILGVAALGLAGGQLVLARRMSIWEPSIEAGNFFLVCMFLWGYRALTSRRPFWCLSLSGLALGLAAGSRPTLVVAGLGLVPLAWFVCSAQRRLGPVPSRSRTLGALALAAIPLGAIGVSLLAYNDARFGNPFDFGLSHQLSTWNVPNKAHFSVGFMPFNAWLYFLSSPQWGRYFPFLHPIDFPILPKGYYGYEYVYGALSVCPVLGWSLFVPFLVWRARPALVCFASAVAASACAVTAVLLSFDTAAARYETDFLPWWVLLGLTGWALIEDRLAVAGSVWPRRILGGLFSLCALFSCAVAFFASVELHGVLELENPGAYRQLSRLFDRPADMWERLTGQRGGAIEMDVTFADRPRESVEPLLITGVEYQRDYVYVYYQSDRVVRLCYLHPGDPVASSGDLAIEPGRTYRIRIECGALYPPEGSPAYDDWGQGEISAFKRWARIDLDGKTVVLEPRGSNEASPGSIQVGADRGNGYCGRRFAGTIRAVRRMGFERPGRNLAGPGDLDAEFALPKEHRAMTLPLIEAGIVGLADLVGLHTDADGSYRYVYESWGAGVWQSRARTLSPAGILRIRARLGPALDLGESSPYFELGRSLVIWEGDKPVWWRRLARPVGPHAPVHVVSNPLGSLHMDPEFGGRLITFSRVPIHDDWRAGPFPALTLQLGGRGEGTEPLVATGIAGQSDTLGIRWLGSDRARLIYDHWGHETRLSPEFSWDGGSVHEVRVAMPSFGSLDASGKEPGNGSLRVSVDGSPVWDTAVFYFNAPSASVSVGRNASGCTTTGAELQSVLVDIRQDFAE